MLFSYGARSVIDDLKVQPRSRHRLAGNLTAIFPLKLYLIKLALHMR
jgi:hypothetical protein